MLPGKKFVSRDNINNTVSFLREHQTVRRPTPGMAEKMSMSHICDSHWFKESEFHCFDSLSSGPFARLIADPLKALPIRCYQYASVSRRGHIQVKGQRKVFCVLKTHARPHSPATVQFSTQSISLIFYMTGLPPAARFALWLDTDVVALTDCPRNGVSSCFDCLIVSVSLRLPSARLCTLCTWQPSFRQIDGSYRCRDACSHASQLTALSSRQID